MHLQINITGVLQFYQKLQIQTEKHLKPYKQTNIKIKNVLVIEAMPYSKSTLRMIVGWFLVGIIQIVASYSNILNTCSFPTRENTSEACFAMWYLLAPLNDIISDPKNNLWV